MTDGAEVLHSDVEILSEVSAEETERLRKEAIVDQHALEMIVRAGIVDPKLQNLAYQAIRSNLYYDNWRTEPPATGPIRVGIIHADT
ncbi:MAG TPA: hypothetical protein VG604_03880 [Candidatus Saccharimonadales bacterium]|nr:hypothetical protein [Candidatus Saccharimonadales bacterium]